MGRSAIVPRDSYGGLFFLDPATRGERAGNVDRVTVLVDAHDVARGIHNERGSIGDSSLIIQHAIKLRHLPVVIGGEGELRA